MQLLVEYAAKLFAAEAPFSEIESKLTTYQQHTGLLFSLESLIQFSQQRPDQCCSR